MFYLALFFLFFLKIKNDIDTDSVFVVCGQLASVVLIEKSETNRHCRQNKLLCVCEGKIELYILLFINRRLMLTDTQAYTHKGY
jgi:hypothetical protein